MLPHLSQFTTICYMKFRKILLEILSRKSPLVPDIEKYTAILIGKRPVRQGLDVVNVSNGDTFNALQRLIEIVAVKAVHDVARGKIIWQGCIHKPAEPIKRFKFDEVRQG